MIRSALRTSFAMLALLALATACSSGPPKPTVGGRGTIDSGRIVGMFETEAAPSRSTGIGKTVGAVGGLLAGVAIGSNEAGRIVGGVFGMLIGSMLGNAAEEALQGGGKKVTEFTVELDDGRTIVVVGDNERKFEVGDRVDVIDNGSGSRLERSTAPPKPARAT
jgi:outer membrane lipoprotein SlyB